MKFSPLGVSYGQTASMRLMLTRRGSGDHKNEVQPPGAVLWANGVDEADVDSPTRCLGRVCLTLRRTTSHGGFSGIHENEVHSPGAALWANGVDEADVDNVVGKGVGGPHWGEWAPCHHP